MLDVYVLSEFERRNRSRKRMFVLHLGDRGFYAETTTVYRAMAYALANQLELVLDCAEFSYSVEKGWNDYFLPICREYEAAMERHVDFHARYPLGSDAPGSPRDLLRYAEQVRYFQIEALELGYLTLRGFGNILRTLAAAAFRLSPAAAAAVSERVEPLALPAHYAAVHARRGDKVGDEDHYYPTELYLDRVPELERSEALFVMSDDYGFVEEVEASLRRRGLGTRVHTLCPPERRGFDIGKVRRGERYFDGGTRAAPRDAAYVFDETVQLLAETLVAAGAASFVSTYGSNVGTVVRWLHPDPTRCPELDRSDLASTGSG